MTGYSSLDADFTKRVALLSRKSPGVIRLRIHPATEGSIDALLRSAIPRLVGMSLKGKLVVADSKGIRSGADPAIRSSYPRPYGRLIQPPVTAGRLIFPAASSQIGEHDHYQGQSGIRKDELFPSP